MWTNSLAFICLVLAGILNACFTLPSRKAIDLSYNEIYQGYSLLGLIGISWSFQAIFFPHSWSLYLELTPQMWMVMTLSGLLFGLGQLCLFRAFEWIGLGLSFAINLSVGVIGGTLAGLYFQNAIFSLRSLLVCLSLACIALGLMALYQSTRQASGSTKEPPETVKSTGNLHLKGWKICLLAGLSSALQGGFFSWILTQLPHHNTENPYWIWPPFFSFAAIAILYGLKFRLKSFLSLLRHPQNCGAFLFMGILTLGSIILYSTGMHQLPPLQQTLGWPIFMISILCTAQLIGWKNYQGAHRLLLGMGFLMILMAIGILTIANRMA